VVKSRGREPEGAGKRPLRVRIDEHHAQTPLGKRISKVNRERGLTDAAFRLSREMIILKF
jgi:hypothetical protein